MCIFLLVFTLLLFSVEGTSFYETFDYSISKGSCPVVSSTAVSSWKINALELDNDWYCFCSSGLVQSTAIFNSSTYADSGFSALYDFLNTGGDNYFHYFIMDLEEDYTFTDDSIFRIRCRATSNTMDAWISFYDIAGNLMLFVPIANRQNGGGCGVSGLDNTKCCDIIGITSRCENAGSGKSITIDFSTIKSNCASIYNDLEEVGYVAVTMGSAGADDDIYIDGLNISDVSDMENNTLPTINYVYDPYICLNESTNNMAFGQLELNLSDSENDEIYYSFQLQDNTPSIIFIEDFDNGVFNDKTYKNASWFISTCDYFLPDIPFYNPNDIYLKNVPFFPQFGSMLYLDADRCNYISGGELMYFFFEQYAYYNHFIELNFFLENGNNLEIVGLGTNPFINLTFNHTDTNEMLIYYGDTMLNNYSLTSTYDFFRLYINVSFDENKYELDFYDIGTGNNLLSFPFRVAYSNYSLAFQNNETYLKGIIFNWNVNDSSFGIDKLGVYGVTDKTPVWMNYTSYNGNYSFYNIGQYKLTFHVTDDMHISRNLYNTTDIFITVAGCDNIIPSGLNSVGGDEIQDSANVIKSSLITITNALDGISTFDTKYLGAMRILVMIYAGVCILTGLPFLIIFRNVRFYLLLVTFGIGLGSLILVYSTVYMIIISIIFTVCLVSVIMGALSPSRNEVIIND